MHEAVSLQQKHISIITVCRNSVRTIAATIESVIAQKEEWVEYLVIDGASTDGTQEVVLSYGKAVDLFVSEADSGIADAFNKGIALSSGAVIGLLNSDDVLLPGALAGVTKCFETDPEIDVLHGDVLLYRDCQFLKRMRPAGRWWYPWRLLMFNHPATFVRRKVYQELGVFDTAYRLAMDAEIFFRWMRNSVVISYLPHPLVRMQAGGISDRQVFRGFGEVRRAALAHGFSPIAVNLQYFSRCFLQFILDLPASSQSVSRERYAGPCSRKEY